MANEIKDYAAKQNAFNTRMAKAIDDIVADVGSLNDKINQLQNNPGPISPEDQALLDQLVNDGQSLADKLDAADALTPPTVPVPAPAPVA